MRRGAGLELPPSHLLVFGNAQVATPMMQLEPRLGIDLPQSLLVYEDTTGTTYVAFTGTSYLQARHDLEDVDTALRQIGDALMAATGSTAGATPVLENFSASAIEAQQGFIDHPSTFGVDTTYYRLKQAVEERGLTVMAEIDHRNNAALVPLEMNPSQVLLFGNPEAGPPSCRIAAPSPSTSRRRYSSTRPTRAPSTSPTTTSAS